MAAAEYVARHQLAGTIQKALTEALATKQPDNPYQALSAWFQAKPLATAAAPAASAFGPDLLDADIQGAIFDIDGTVLDTMPGFFPSWVFACNRLGLSITEEEFYGFAGQPMPDIIAQLHRNAGKGEMPDDYVQEFYKHKSEGMAEAHPDGFYPAPIDCVVELMKGFIARGVPVACATSGLREHVNEHMSHAGLLELCPHERIVVAADLPAGRGKPQPDIFLEAAKKIGVDPTKCRAFEDGESGLLAAYRAGMQVIDVTGMDGYPLPHGLKLAKEKQAAARSWHK